MLDSLPCKLFGGALLANKFFHCVCREESPSIEVPSRLPVLMALGLQNVDYGAGEFVYTISDFPFAMFFVQTGTFACIALPTKEGGLSTQIVVQGSHDAMHESSTA